jgi:CRP-like cAMP-binding protein
MNYVKGQFICLPQMLFLDSLKLKYTDTLIYVAIRSFDNGIRGCYPAYETIAKRAGCSRDYVIKAIHRLEFTGFLSVIRSTKIKNVNRYSFSPIKDTFEQIPYQIFEADLSIYEKSILICLRQFFNTAGKLASRATIRFYANSLGLSYKTVHKQLTSVIAKGYVTQGTGRNKSLFKFTDKIDWNWDYGQLYDSIIEPGKLKVS